MRSFEEQTGHIIRYTADTQRLGSQAGGFVLSGMGEYLVEYFVVSYWVQWYVCNILVFVIHIYDII